MTPLGCAGRAFMRRDEHRCMPVLLAAFVAGVLIVVAVVAWLGRTGDPWLVAAAVVLTLGLLVAMGGRLVELLADGRVERRRRLSALAAAAALAALLGPLLVPAIGRGSLAPPATTVRDFLGAAVVDRDGVSACRYVAAAERARLDDRERDTCERFFGGATLRLGRETIDANAQLAAARYTVTARGHDRLVTVSAAGGSATFLVAPASAVERAEFMAPPTPWRIAAGVARL